jgi:hypothetical protein
MQKAPLPPDTSYFIYFYVFTCEKCNQPQLQLNLLAEIPQDDKTHQAAFGYTCSNCGHIEFPCHRPAVYTKWLQVKNSKCSERDIRGNAVLS